ncbi:MAG: GNAT family N-acetyltransferase [Bdellovibrionales bacterium]|nr:GNAT family N-acetyltransferase [Bdellovibrionales bacterium]
MDASTDLTSKTLSESIWPDIVNFFEYKGTNSGCWCMNHRMHPGEVVEGDAAKELLKDGISRGQVNGLLFYDDSKPIGWCAIDKAGSLIGHDCFQSSKSYEDSEWSIHCLCLIAEYRGKGLEKEMLVQAELYLAEQSAKRVEAYPEPGSRQGSPFSTWNTFCGYESDYLQAGFEKLEPVDPNYSMLEKTYQK